MKSVEDASAFSTPGMLVVEIETHPTLGREHIESLSWEYLRGTIMQGLFFFCSAVTD